MIRTIEKLVDELVAAHEKKPFVAITLRLQLLERNEKDYHNISYYEDVISCDQAQIMIYLDRLVAAKLRIKQLKEKKLDAKNNNELPEGLQKTVQEEIKKSSKALWEGEK